MDLRSVYEAALAAHRAGNLAQAEKLYRDMLRADGRNFSALHMLGFLKAQQGQFEDAIALMAKALKANPGDLGALTNYAHALMAAQRQDEALAAYERILAVQPNQLEALYNRGVVLSEHKRFAEALASFDRALALKPDAAATLYSRGVALSAMGRHPEALANYDRALALQPNLTLANGNRALSALNIADWKRTAEIAPEITAMIRAGIAIPPQTLLGYSSDKVLQLQAGRNMLRSMVPQPLPPLWRGETYRHAKIRLAYVSYDLSNHAVGQQLVSLIERHDRTRFEVIGISTGPDDGSSMRARIVRAFDQFHDFSRIPPDAIAQRMRAMEIDIAVDLGGHTDGGQPQIFAFRPAPVQAAFLGYPATTGADFIDYLIGDATVTPPEHQPFFSERLVQLPDTYFPTDTTLAIGPVPGRAQAGLPDDGFVFCAFNGSWKITAPVFDVWMRLLTAVPGSVLWLKGSNAAARQNLEREAAARGVDTARLIFAPDVALEDHLARQSLAGIFLDTLPYNAHATAAHALWAGLPVVTCEGDAFAGRVGASLLKAAGLPELVTGSLAEYEVLALRLAQEPDLLNVFKERLKEGRTSTPLFDGDRFRAAIEAAFLTMQPNR